MVRDEEKYTQAVEFRKRGFTYSEIAKIVGISKSTVSAWFSKKLFSKRVRKDNEERARRDNVQRISLLNKARNAERKARYSEALRSADTEYKHYKHNPLFTAGLMLYMSHGDMQDSSRIRLTTQNHDAHRIFIKFLNEYFGIENKQLSFWLLLYKNMDNTDEMKWWSKHIKLSVANFGKIQYISQSQPKKTLHHGTGNTILGSVVLKLKLKRWIELTCNDLK